MATRDELELVALQKIIKALQGLEDEQLVRVFSAAGTFLGINITNNTKN